MCDVVVVVCDGYSKVFMCCILVRVGSAVDALDSAVDASGYCFSPDAQPFTPKTSNGTLSVMPDEPAVCGKTTSCILSPNAPEFVPKNFIPPTTDKVLLFACMKCHCLFDLLSACFKNLFVFSALMHIPGCVSGSRCRFAYCPADSTATHCLCCSKSRLVLPSWFYLSGASSPV